MRGECCRAYKIPLRQPGGCVERDIGCLVAVGLGLLACLIIVVAYIFSLEVQILWVCLESRAIALFRELVLIKRIVVNLTISSV